MPSLLACPYIQFPTPTSSWHSVPLIAFVKAFLIGTFRWLRLKFIQQRSINSLRSFLIVMSTMTSADSSRQVLLRKLFQAHVREASLGKNAIFPVIYPPHLHLKFCVALGFSLSSNLTHYRMPDAVPVRRTNGLPRASFRFHLAMDTLASGYALGATPCARDFHPLDCAHARRTRIGSHTEPNIACYTN